MKQGDRVVRVSLRSDEGTIGERGTVAKVFEHGGETFGYNVQWDKPDAAGLKRAGYVAPVRVRTVEEAEAGAARPLTGEVVTK